MSLTTAPFQFAAAATVGFELPNILFNDNVRLIINLLQSREVEKENCQHVADTHPSVTAVFDLAFRQNGGRRPTPVQIAEANDAIQQQQLTMAQQQAAAQQVRLRFLTYSPDHRT